MVSTLTCLQMNNFPHFPILIRSVYTKSVSFESQIAKKFVILRSTLKQTSAVTYTGSRDWLNPPYQNQQLSSRWATEFTPSFSWFMVCIGWTRQAKTFLPTCRDSDHPAHTLSIIRAFFALHSCFVVLDDSVSGQRSWSNCMNAQTDLGHRCLHKPDNTFSHSMVHIMLSYTF